MSAAPSAFSAADARRSLASSAPLRYGISASSFLSLASALVARAYRFTGQAKTVLILSRSASAVSQTQNKQLISNKIEGRGRAITRAQKIVNPN